LSASVNAERALYAEAPVNDDATQGTESVLKMLTSGLDPTMTVSRTLDGQGGAYGHQLDAPLGRFARINANLSFEYDSFSDLTDTGNLDNGTTGGNYSFSLNGRPRELTINHDGSTTSGSDSLGSIQFTSLVSFESLGSWRLTFENVSFTRNDTGNALAIGISDADVITNFVSTTGNAIFFDIRGADSGVTLDNGTETDSFINPSIDFSQEHDLSIEYDGSTVRFLVDGSQVGSGSFSVNADYLPFVTLVDDDSATASETVSIGQITVEPIGGTF
jgi:hypothetical protein